MSILLRNIILRYIPAVTVPIAAVIGFIGYNLESRYSKSINPPYHESVQKKRADRMIEEMNEENLRNVDRISLKNKEFVPKTIFEKNLSPSLQDQP